MEVIIEKYENGIRQYVEIRHYKKKTLRYYIYKWYWKTKGYEVKEVEYGR